MLWIIVISILLIYLFSIPLIRKEKFGRPVVLPLRIMALSSAAILLVLIILSRYNIYPRGYVFSQVLFWMLVLPAMAISGLCRRDLFSELENGFYRFIFLLPLGFGFFLLAPGFGTVAGYAFYQRFIGDGHNILYTDNNIRIEDPDYVFLSNHPSFPQLYVKKSLFAYRDTLLPILVAKPSDLRVNRLNDSVYQIIAVSAYKNDRPLKNDTAYYILQ